MDGADDKGAALGEQQKKEKPWGHERAIAEFRGVFLKELSFRAGKASSLHYHEKKDEFFYVARGLVKVVLDDHEVRLAPGDTLHIHPGQRHRIVPLKDTVILELASRMFGDVHRIEDVYHRPSHE